MVAAIEKKGIQIREGHSRNIHGWEKEQRKGDKNKNLMFAYGNLQKRWYMWRLGLIVQFIFKQLEISSP